MKIRDSISICPECKQQIDAMIYEDKDDGKIYMKKNCSEHGDFKDVLAANSSYYLWRKDYQHESREAAENPEVKYDCGPFSPLGGKEGKKGCPYDCGICENHKSATTICLIDITNRCNLKCPICFANANVTGFVVEPTMEEIRTIMTHFRATKPIAPVALQLSGGEPTVRNDLPEILEMSKELGFAHRMLTTNALRFTNIDYLQEIIDAGMNAMYMQFDSASDPNVYLQTRGVDLLAKKMKVIENCRELGFKDVMLIPTIARGINDDQIGDILRFAVENQDVVSCLVYQPVSLCGRITQQEIMKMRFNATDVFESANQYMKQRWGQDFGEKYYPISTMTNFVKLLTWFDDVEAFEMATHEDCGFATIGVVETHKDRTKNQLHIIDEYFDVPGIIKNSDRIWNFLKENNLENPQIATKLLGDISPGLANVGEVLDKAGSWALRKVLKYSFIGSLIPKMKLNDPKNLIPSIRKLAKVLLRPGWTNAANFLRDNALLVSSMHFQDAYNMQEDRVSRCIVHYGVYDRELKQVFRVPFCTMNSIHRPVIEKKNAQKQEVLAEVQMDY